MQKSLSDLFSNLLKMEGSMTSAFEKPSAAITRDIEFVKRLESQIEQTMGVLEKLPSEMTKGFDEGGANKMVETYQKVESSVKKAVDTIKADLNTLGQQSEVKSLLGLDKLPEQASQAATAIKKVEDQFATLKDKLASMQDSLLSNAFNPRGIQQLENAIPSLEGKLAKLQDQFAKTSESMGKLGAGSAPQEIAKVGEQISKLEGEANRLGQVMNTTAKQAEGGGSYGRLSSVFGGLNIQTAALAAGFFGWFTVINTGISTVERLVSSVVSAGVEWQRTMATIQNATGASDATVKNLAASSMQLASDTGQSAQGIAKAYQQAYQELGTYERAQAAVTEGARDATSTQEEVGSVTKALATVLHNYNVAAEDTRTVNNQLFGGFQQSGESLATFTEHVASASAITARYKIPLGDLISLVAGLDKATGGAAIGAAQLNTLIERLEQPSSKLREDLLQLDPAIQAAFSREAIEAPGGLQRAFEALIQSESKVPGIFRDAVGPIGNARDALVLTGNEVKTVNEVMAKMADVSAGKAVPANEAFARSSQTAATGADRFKENAGNLFKVLGTHVAGGLTELFKNMDTSAAADSLIKYKNALGLTDEEVNKLAKDMVAAGEHNPDNFLFPKQNNVKFDFVDKIKAGADDATQQTDATAKEVVASIATSISSIAKGIDDSMKLLAEGAHFQLPPDIESRIKPFAEGLKTIYDTFAESFKDIKNTNPTLDAAVKGVASQIDAVLKMAELFQKLPSISVQDPANKIAALVATAVKVNEQVSKAFTDGKVDETAALMGELAKGVGEEVKVLTDVAGLYKAMEGVNLGQPESSFVQLATTSGNISKIMGPILNNVEGDPETLSKVAELLGREATALKDVAGLYKEMDGVNLGQPDSAFARLAETAAKVHGYLEPTLQSVTGDPEAMSKVAELLGREATALKDVAGLYKEMSGVSLGQPDSAFAQLARTAAVIHQDISGLLQSVTGDPDHLSKVAELIGREATTLKDVAGLYKEMAGVSLDQPDSAFAQLARTAATVHQDISGLLQSVTGDPDALGKVAEMLGREATALKDAAGLIKEMAAVDFNVDPTEGIDKLVNVLEHANDILGPYLATQGGQDYSKLAESAGKVVTAIKDTAALVKDAQTLDTIDESRLREQIDQLVNVLQGTLKYFDDSLVKLNNNSEVVGKIASDAGNVMKGVGEAIKVIQGMEELPHIDEGQMKSAIDEIVRIMQATLEYFDKQIVSLKNNSKISDIAKEAGDVMKAVDDTLKVFETMASKKGLVLDPKAITASIETAIAAVKYFMSAIDSSGLSLGDVDKASRFAEAISKIFDAIDKVQKATGKGHGAGGGATFGNIAPNINNLRQVVNSMLGAGGSDNAVITGAAKYDNLFGQQQQSNPFQNFPSLPLPQFMSGLQNGGVLQEPFATGRDHNPPLRPAPVPPRPPGEHNAPAPPAPHHKAEAGGGQADQSVLNVDVVMDGSVLARSLNNKMFNNQTLRANLVPSQAGPR